MCRLFVQQWKKYNNELGRFVIVFYFNVTKEIDDDKLGTNLAPPGLLGAWTKKENHNEHPLVVIFSWCIKTKQKKGRRASLSLSFLGAQKKNKKTTTNINLSSSFSLGALKQKKKRWQQVSVHHHLLWVHRKKKWWQVDSSSFSLGA